MNRQEKLVAYLTAKPSKEETSSQEAIVRYLRPEKLREDALAKPPNDDEKVIKIISTNQAVVDRVNSALKEEKPCKTDQSKTSCQRKRTYKRASDSEYASTLIKRWRKK